MKHLTVIANAMERLETVAAAFDDMTPTQQKKYLKDHPNSKHNPGVSKVKPKGSFPDVKKRAGGVFHMPDSTDVVKHQGVQELFPNGAKVGSGRKSRVRTHVHHVMHDKKSGRSLIHVGIDKKHAINGKHNHFVQIDDDKLGIRGESKWHDHPTKAAKDAADDFQKKLKKHLSKKK